MLAWKEDEIVAHEPTCPAKAAAFSVDVWSKGLERMPPIRKAEPGTVVVAQQELELFRDGLFILQWIDLDEHDGPASADGSQRATQHRPLMLFNVDLDESNVGDFLSIQCGALDTELAVSFIKYLRHAAERVKRVTSAVERHSERELTIRV